jgi:hypothetical protein
LSAETGNPAASNPESIAFPGDEAQTLDAPSEPWGTISGGWPEVVVPGLMVMIGVAAAGLAILRTATLAGRSFGRGWLPCVFRTSQVYRPSARVALLDGDGKGLGVGRTTGELPIK